MLRMMITMMMVMMRPLSQRVNPQLRTLVYGSGPLRGSAVVSCREVFRCCRWFSVLDP